MISDTVWFHSHQPQPPLADSPSVASQLCFPFLMSHYPYPNMLPLLIRPTTLYATLHEITGSGSMGVCSTAPHMNERKHSQSSCLAAAHQPRSSPARPICCVACCCPSPLRCCLSHCVWALPAPQLPRPCPYHCRLPPQCYLPGQGGTATGVEMVLARAALGSGTEGGGVSLLNVICLV